METITSNYKDLALHYHGHGVKVNYPLRVTMLPTNTKTAVLFMMTQIGVLALGVLTMPLKRQNNQGKP